jgi:hypothetical protein
MKIVDRLFGFGLIGVDKRPWRSRRPARRLQLASQAAGIPAIMAIVALVVVASTNQGCSNTSSQTAAAVYPGPSEYAAYGYPDDLYATYDPFFYGYYWSLPYYYTAYSGGDGDHDCDDGFCGPEGGRPPHQPWRVGSLPERLPPPERTEVSQRSIVSVQSVEPANSNLSADSHAAGVTSSAFGGGEFHSGGFSGSAMNSGGFGGGFHSGGFGGGGFGGGFSGGAHR